MALLKRALPLWLAAAACATVPPPRTQVVEPGVHFVHRAPGARAVAVVGTFNGWTPMAMKLNGSGAFEAMVAVPPGLHRFAFQVTSADGSVRIVPPESADGFEEDGFGSKNGTLDVDSPAARPGNLIEPASSVGTGSD